MRRAVKFDDWQIPALGRRETPQIESREASMLGFRTDGAYSAWGDTRAPLAPRDYTVGFILSADASAHDKEASFEANKDAMLQALARGRKRLWFSTMNAGIGGEMFAFAYARSISMPREMYHSTYCPVEVTFRLDNPILYKPMDAAAITAKTYTPVTVASANLGESWDENVFASFTINASPYTFSINNDGQLRTTRLLVRLESLGANGYTNPKVENLTLAQSIQTTTDGANANARWQANAYIGFSRVRSSVDAGVNWSNDWPNVTLGSDQGVIMELAPGNNQMKYTDGGTPNLRLMVLWLPAYMF